MSQNDILSDEAFESQIDADSAEPVAAAPAKAEEPTGSPIIDRLKEISADISGVHGARPYVFEVCCLRAEDGKFRTRPPGPFGGNLDVRIDYELIRKKYRPEDITSRLQEEYEVDYHPGHVRKLLQDLGFSVQRPRKRLARGDPVLQDRWQRYTYPRLKKNR